MEVNQPKGDVYKRQSMSYFGSSNIRPHIYSISCFKRDFIENAVSLKPKETWTQGFETGLYVWLSFKWLNMEKICIKRKLN